MTDETVSTRVTWATSSIDGILVGDLHAWRKGEDRSVCLRAFARALQVPNFSQTRAAEIGCPSCIRALAKDQAD